MNPTATIGVVAVWFITL